MLVPSAKQTYDPVLAHALWEASEVAVGLSEPPTSLLPSQLGTHKHAPAEVRY